MVLENEIVGMGGLFFFLGGGYFFLGGGSISVFWPFVADGCDVLLVLFTDKYTVSYRYVFDDTVELVQNNPQARGRKRQNCVSI